MSKLAQLRVFVDAYYAEATQHQTSRIAGEWMEMGVSASQAAQWANAGYRPAEAAPLIAQGVTLETAREMDQLAEDIAGSREERAMQVIDGLVADGVLVDPRNVRREQDPDDPHHEIVHILSDDQQG